MGNKLAFKDINIYSKTNFDNLTETNDDDLNFSEVGRVVVEVIKGNDGYSECVIWSDGYCEQRGTVTISQGYGTVSFFREMTGYTPVVNQTYGSTTTTYVYADIMSTDSCSSTGFRVIASDNSDGGSNGTAVWEAKGYLV